MNYKYINNLKDKDQQFNDILDENVAHSCSPQYKFSTEITNFIEKNQDFKLDYHLICHSSSRYTSYRTVNLLGFILKKLTTFSGDDFDTIMEALAPRIGDQLFSKKEIIELSDEELVKIQDENEKSKHFDNNKKHILSKNYERVFHLFTDNFTKKEKYENESSEREVARFVKNFQLLFNNTYRKSLIDLSFLSNDRFYKMLQLDNGNTFEHSKTIIDLLFADNKEQAYMQIFSHMHFAKQYSYAKEYKIDYTAYIEKIKEMPFFSYDKVPGEGYSQSFIRDLYTKGLHSEFERLKSQPDIYKLLKKDFNEVFLDRICNYIFEDISYSQGISMNSKNREKMLKKIQEDMLKEFNIKMFEESYGMGIVEAINKRYKTANKNAYITKRLYKITDFYEENKEEMFIRNVEEEKEILMENINVNVSSKNTVRI